jgi:hypothetical protein
VEPAFRTLLLLCLRCFVHETPLLLDLGISDVQDLFRKICKDAGVGQPQVAAEVTLNAIHAYTIKSSCHNMSVKPRDYAKYLSQLLEKNK